MGILAIFQTFREKKRKKLFHVPRYFLMLVCRTRWNRKEWEQGGSVCVCVRVLERVREKRFKL